MWDEETSVPFAWLLVKEYDLNGTYAFLSLLFRLLSLIFCCTNPAWEEPLLASGGTVRNLDIVLSYRNLRCFLCCGASSVAFYIYALGE